jgi:hypothetical protein
MESNEEEISVKRSKLNNDYNNNIVISSSINVNNSSLNNNSNDDDNNNNNILLLLKGIEYKKEIPENIINRLSNDKYVIEYNRLINLLKNIYQNISKIDFLEYDLSDNDDGYKLVRELIKEYNNENKNYDYNECRSASDIYKLKKKLKKISSVEMFLMTKNEGTSFDYMNDNIIINNHNNNKQIYYENLKSLPYPKLLIFDLNKVLVYRKKFTSKFILRPYAIDFLNILSSVGKYQIAIWTSAKRKSVVDIMNKFFSSINFQLYFQWYQPKCTVVPPPPEYPFISKSIQNKDDSKPIFTKDLDKVWSEFPLFWQYNTILIDDSPVKCINNNSFNCLHPLPFDLSDQLIPNSSLQDTSFNIVDEELNPSGNLCKYLLKYSQYNDSIENFVVNKSKYSFKI